VPAQTHSFSDDGGIPNSPLPVLVYHDVAEARRAADCEQLFAANGWLGAWRNGIYPLHHFHSTAHEVLGIAEGCAKVQLGGPQGLLVNLNAGDAVAIPAGVGHCLVEGNALVVVGAYPDGQDWDLCRATATDRVKALENIPWVSLPELDPVYGAEGPLLARWVD
jgi:uncharacterized protein YjlB